MENVLHRGDEGQYKAEIPKNVLHTGDQMRIYRGDILKGKGKG